MFISIFAFFLGDLSLQQFSQLPSFLNCITIIAIGTLFSFTLYKNTKYFYLPIAFATGFVYTAWYAASILAWSLPPTSEGEPIEISGYIASIPQTEQSTTHFDFKLADKSALVRLSWHDAQKSLQAGDQWCFLVKLKRIHGIQSPGAFDFEGWALQKGIRATGSVIASAKNRLLTQHWYHFPLARLRQYIQIRLLPQMPNTKTSAWLMALIIGERSGIAQEEWQVLRNTGTNHLMAIAGLHIGIIAALARSLIQRIWRHFPRLLERLPVQEAGALGALGAALFYSALSGFSLPTQRACIMLCIFILALLTRRKINPWHAWSCAMFLVLLLNPLSVLTESFWLSFGTIALIMYGMGARLAPTGLWWRWGRVQWVIGVGLIPISLALFQQSSLISFVANSIAIPWLACLILPFCFLSSLLVFITPKLCGILLWCADKSLACLWLILSWLAQLDFATITLALPNHMLLFSLITGFILLLLPNGMPGRWLGLVWLGPIFWLPTASIKQGHFSLAILDVGQGLSAVVQTQHHTLVYDAGPKLLASQDMGEYVVLPYLRTRQIRNIDMLVVSHGDNDHIGGTQALLAHLPVNTIMSSVPKKFTHPKNYYCLSGYHWQWDGVRFAFLYPNKANLQLGNDSSCVLLIDNGVHRVLLPGDIEKQAELNLLATQKKNLAADILIAPHHGSKTSGVPAFIASVHPYFVIYATGYRNRYHFPHTSVLISYNEIKAQALNTTTTGTIVFTLDFARTIHQPILYRHDFTKYWYD